LDTPEGQSKILVVDDGGEVIAHEAMIPMRFHVFDREFLGGKIEDAYIDRKHRGKKLFGPLTEYCLDSSERSGYALTFGLTGRPVNYQLHISRGFRDICSLNAHLAVLEPAKAASDAARALRLSSAKRVALRSVLGALSMWFKRKATRYSKGSDPYPIERITRFDDRFDQLWHDFIENRTVITIKRSSDFLNWRYIDNPYREYAVFAATDSGRVVGYLVAAVVTREDMHLESTVGVTSDFLVLPGYETVFPSFLRRAVDFWRGERADLLINWVHRDGKYSRPLATELKRCGFVSTFGRYDIPYFVRTLGDDINDDAFYGVDHWHVTQAYGGAWV
jgi:hypothetical protein